VTMDTAQTATLDSVTNVRKNIPVTMGTITKSEENPDSSRDGTPYSIRPSCHEIRKFTFNVLLAES
jgi:hypothetical protein